MRRLPSLPLACPVRIDRRGTWLRMQQWRSFAFSRSEKDAIGAVGYSTARILQTLAFLHDRADAEFRTHLTWYQSRRVMQEAVWRNGICVTIRELEGQTKNSRTNQQWHDSQEPKERATREVLYQARQSSSFYNATKIRA